MTAHNRHKLALLTWCILYPMITILIVVLDPFLRDAAIPFRTLVLTLIMVPAMVYGALPFATSRLRKWLADEPKAEHLEIEKNRNPEIQSLWQKGDSKRSCFAKRVDNHS